MATRALEKVKFIKGRDGKAPEFETLTVIGTEPEGSLLVKVDNASTVCADSAVIVTHIATTSLANSLPGVTTSVPILIIRSGDTYQMSCWHTTAASAVFPDTLLDAQGAYPVVLKTVSGVQAWCLDVANITTTPAVRVVGRDPRDNGTDLYPRLFVQFLSTVTGNT